MIHVGELGARVIVAFGDGSVFLSESILWGFILAAILAVLGIWMGHGLETVPTTKRQIAAELIVGKIYDYAKQNLGNKAETFAPYMGTIFIYILLGSSLGLLGLRPITADVNVTFSLSLLTFLLIQISGFRYLGVKGKLKHMCEPYPFMLPLNILEDCTLPISLALRLFGNIFGGMIVVELWMYFMEWLSAFVSSVPFMRAVFVLPLNAFFDIFEPVIQTYIFVTLTMVFLSKGIAGADKTMKRKREVNENDNRNYCNRGRSGNRPRGNRYRDRTGDPREQGGGKHGETARSDERNPRVDDHRDGHYGNYRRIDLRHRHRVGRQDLIGAGERRAE